MPHDLNKPPATGLTHFGVASASTVLDVAPMARLAAADAPTWDVAEDVVTAPDRAYVVANYIHGGPPSNRNGHIFRSEELPSIHRYIPGIALDMLHDADRVVGAHMAARVVQPAAQAAISRYGQPDYSSNPVVQILGQVWTFRHPKDAKDIQEAFAENKAWVSHSSLPETVECPVCGHKAPWDDYTSPLYCDHMQGVNDKIFNNPLFIGGAIIIPPIRPGWSDARISSVRAALHAHPDQAATVAADMAALSDGRLTQLQLEVITGELLARAHAEDPAIAKTISRLVGPGWEKRVAGYETDLTLPAELAQAAGLDRELTPTEVRALVDRTAEGDSDVDTPLAAWAALRFSDLVREDIERMTTPKAAAAGAMEDGTFDILNLVDLRSGMNAWAAAADRRAVKAHLVARAAVLGAPAELLEEIAVLGLDDAALAARNEWTTAIVALVPPRPIAEAVAALSQGQFDADEVHVTLAFLGQIVPEYGPDGEEYLSELVMLEGDDHGWAGVSSRPYINGALSAWAAAETRIEAKLSGRGTFNQGDAGETVYVSIDAPGLEDLRGRLMAAFEHARIAVSRLHGFTPHMTITDGLPPGQGPATAPDGRWMVDGVELWWGGEHHRIEIP